MSTPPTIPEISIETTSRGVSQLTRAWGPNLAYFAMVFAATLVGMQMARSDTIALYVLLMGFTATVAGIISIKKKPTA